MAAPAASGSTSRLGFFRQFSPVFWLINGIEFLERGAYYGMLAVFSYHLVYNRGYTSDDVGSFLVILQPLLYFVPLLAAPLAEKYGFRKTLPVAFAILALGYFSLGFVSGTQGIFIAILILGIGAGVFKPIAAACIAHTTTSEQRNFGFTIYYWGINFGAFLVPLLIGVLFPQSFYGFVFYASAAMIVANLLITILFFRNPVPPQLDKDVLANLRKVGDAFKEKTFLVLLAIYAGFWFMYAQFQFYAPLYMTDFGVMPAWFTVAFLATINPGTIILLGPAVGKITSKFNSLPVMITGIGLYILGIAALGLVNYAPLFILGAVLLSIGEVVTHPNFLSYVSKIAPQDRVAVYMGVAFLPVGVGLTVGSKVGGRLYREFAEIANRPALYWSIVAAVGIVTIGALLFYNAVLQRRKAPAQEPRRGGILASRATGAIVILLLLPAVLGAATLGGTQTFLRPGGANGLESSSVAGAGLTELKLDPVAGTTAAGQTTEETVDVNATARNVTFTLTWRDEPTPGVPTATNGPDSLRLTVTTPDGTVIESPEAANPAGGEGKIVVLIEGPVPAGAYKLAVEVTRAGSTTLGPGVELQSDRGNAWTLAGSYLAPAAGR